MVTLICSSRWICCLWSILPTRLGTACSSHWAIDLSLTSWFYLNPCLWPCPLCFGSTLHFAKRSGLCCSIAAFFSLKNLPRGQSCKLYPSSILIHHLDQASRIFAKTEVKSTLFFPSLAELAIQRLLIMCGQIIQLQMNPVTPKIKHFYSPHWPFLHCHSNFC